MSASLSLSVQLATFIFDISFTCCIKRYLYQLALFYYRFGALQKKKPVVQRLGVIPGWTSKRRLLRTGFAGKCEQKARLTWASLEVLHWSLLVLPEITGNSLFWVKLFGGLAPKIDREGLPWWFRD